MHPEFPFASAAGSTPLSFLIEAATKGTALIAAAALLAFVLRRGSAAHRHLLWACALGGLAALPALLAVLPAWRVNAPILAWVTPLPAPAVTGTGATDESTVPTVWSGPASRPAPAPVDPPLRATGQSPRRAPGAAANSATPAGAWPAWLAWPVALWALGAFLVLGTVVAGHLLLRLLLRRARPIRDAEWHALAMEAADALRLTAPFALLESAAVQVPVAFGLLRPRVLLPAGAGSWPVERRRAVLLHELAHVKRHDCVTQAVAQLACALFWFHPAVWWAAARLRVEREQACDDRVLGARTRASEYADQLLEMVRSLRATRLAALGAVAFARPSNLEGRLLAVLDPRRDRRAVGLRIVFPAAALAALVLLPFAALDPVQARSAHGASADLETRNDPQALRPSRVVVVPADGRSLEQRVAWARTEAARSKAAAWWIGWPIEVSATMKGNLLSDSEGIRLELLGRNDLFSLEDVLVGRDRGTADASSRDKSGPKPAAVLVRLTAEGPDRVRVQTVGLPVEFAGQPLYWMPAVKDEESFAWLRDAAARTRDVQMRAELVESIGFMRNSALVTSYLSATLAGTEPEEVRAGAAESMGRHPSPEVVKQLANHARTDRYAEVRRAAVEALGQARTPEALQELLAIARAPEAHEDARRTAWEALGEEVAERSVAPTPPVAPAQPAAPTRPAAPTPTVPRTAPVPHTPQVPPVPPDEPSQPMSGPDFEVKRQAIESLGRYPEAQSLMRLKEIAETSPNGDLRAEAVESMGRIGTPGALAVIEQIVWKNRQERARQAAVEAIARHFPDEQALDKLSVIARTHPSPETRRMAVEALGRLDSPRAAQALEQILDRDGDVDVQREAVETLARRDDAGVEQRLLRIARSNRPIEVRRQAVESLGRLDGSRTADLLLEIAKADAPEEVQRQATESLGRLDDARVKGMLLDLARLHRSLEIQRQAVESLGRLQAEVMPELATIARTHPSSDVRRQAVESMTRRDPDQALPLIEEILRQPKK